MKQSHIGIDMIEISRIRQAIARWGEHFLTRIYNDTELDLYRGKPESLAARFAGKEAAMKALASAGPIGWRDVEILSEPSGKPVVHLHGKAWEKAKALELCGLEISLSHTREYAIAIVMGIYNE